MFSYPFLPGSLCNLRRGVFTLLAVSFLSATLLFTGCKTETDDPGNLNGTWINVYSDPEHGDFITTIKINTPAKTIVYEGDYEGSIVNSPDYDSASGVLIIKFTKITASWDNPENVGKFGTMYWTGLTSGSVNLSDAFTGYARTVFTTQALAEAAFTPYQDKAGNYVDWSYTSPYTRSK